MIMGNFDFLMAGVLSSTTLRLALFGWNGRAKGANRGVSTLLDCGTPCRLEAVAGKATRNS